jgi:ribonuclease HI
MRFIRSNAYKIKAIAFLDQLIAKAGNLKNKKGIVYGEIKYLGCAVCGARNELNIHHLNYIEDITMLLCSKCHERVHFGHGLEHLNPIGKKQWINSTIRLERIGEIELPRIDELIEFRGYAMLLNALTNKKEDIWREIILDMEHSRLKTDELIKASYFRGSSIELKEVNIYTDGACIGNPGPGGYAAILKYGKQQKEISGGYKLTTNNRMEIMAVIVGLEALKDVCSVTVWSDSEYLVKAMNEGWTRKWKQYNWRLNNRKKAANIDLWDRLLKLCEIHDVDFEWVKGHNDNKENVRCDELANIAAYGNNLQEDYGYEKKVKPEKLL